MGKLTEVFVKQVKVLNAPDGTPRDKKHSDGDSMYLVVSAKGGKFFRWKYRYGGKEKALSLGEYPKVTLKAAREAVIEARAQLAKNIDPGAAKQELKREARLAVGNLFRDVADEWHKTRETKVAAATWDKEDYVLTRFLKPKLGGRPIGDIEPPELLSVLEEIKESSLDLAHRSLYIVRDIYHYALAKGWVNRNPTYDLRGMLPTAKTKHFAAVTDPSDFGALLRRIDETSATPAVAAALRILPLVFCRPGELQKMRWSEIDFERAEWRYTVTKVDLEHNVFLSRQVLKILEDLKPITGRHEYVFVVREHGGYMSSYTLNSALRRLKIDKDEQTAHGFRAAARTMLAERLKIEPRIIEQQLSHKVPDSLGRAYNRALYVDERREMMQLWADYCDELKMNSNKPQG